MSEKRWKIGVFLENVHFAHPKATMTAIEKAFSDKQVDVHYILGTESIDFSRGLSELQAQYDNQYLSIYDYEKFEDFDFIIMAYGNMNIAGGIDNKEKYLEKFSHVPCAILQDETVPKLGFNIMVDNYGGMKQIIDHLIEDHGCENILFLSGPEHNEDSLQRRQAYLESMIMHGCPVSDTMIKYGDYSENVDHIVEELLDENEKVDAIASANDEMASSVYRVCEKRGLVVGKDILVTGFDDVPLAGMLNPPLTTVRQPSYLMGEIAAGLALDYLEGKEVSPLTKIPVELVIRSSCGCEYKKEDKKPGQADTSMSEVMEDSRRTWNYALTGPIITRELVSVSDDVVSFFTRMASHLRDIGAASSYLFVQKEAMINTAESGYNMADEVYLVFEQKGNDITVYTREESPRRDLRAGLIPKGAEGDPARQFFSFLIFDGERQYGILAVEIKSQDIPYFFLASLHLGTAFHFHEINNSVIAERRRLIRQNQKLSYNANSDPLTGLFNRRGVERQITDTVNANIGKRACLMIGDLDHLKEINDTFGHTEGDFAIKACSEVLRRVIGDGAPLGRIGGDEFLGLFLIEEDENQEVNRRIADVKLSDDLFNTISGKPYYLGISIGTYCFDCTEDIVLDQLIKNADESLYEAKKKRRETVSRSDEELVMLENAEGFSAMDSLGSEESDAH